jgi:hypothetical protein
VSTLIIVRFIAAPYGPRSRGRAVQVLCPRAEEASILLDRPPGGWNDLVTNQMLEARLGAIFVAFGMFATLVKVI